MTDQQHPLTPPPELVWQWRKEWCSSDISGDYDEWLVARAAEWVSDKELDACCEWLRQQTLCGHVDLIPSLRTARRPKPPSLKQQALEALEALEAIEQTWAMPNSDSVITIRRALEALPE